MTKNSERLQKPKYREEYLIPIRDNGCGFANKGAMPSMIAPEVTNYNEGLKDGLAYHDQVISRLPSEKDIQDEIINQIRINGLEDVRFSHRHFVAQAIHKLIIKAIKE